MTPSANFQFLAEHDPQLVELATRAELYLFADPNTCLIKLRQFAEVLAQQTAARTNNLKNSGESQRDLLQRLRSRNILTEQVARLFHALRQTGNAATHEIKGCRADAEAHLKIASELAAWFHRTFGSDAAFQPPPFVLPPDPAQQSREKQEESARLARELLALKDTAEETRAENRRLAAALAQLQAQAAATPAPQLQALVSRAATASEAIQLNEAATRLLIDEDLRRAGWEVDTRSLTYSNGARPEKGKNRAISEWPTENGPADYVLFAGLQVVGVVEAKRKHKAISASLEQAKRYSRGYVIKGNETLPGPYEEYRVPFLCATNGRPYLRQLLTESGIWFLDARRPNQNIARALAGWYTPEGLLALLEQDVAQAEKELLSEPTGYLGLRSFQLDAIKAVEKAIASGQRECLLAMATGTGKTRTCLGLIYRLIKTRRFRRVLFIVDRTSLGEQASTVFKDVRLENNKSIADTYDIKELKDVRPDATTKLHVATIQSLIRRILATEDDEDRPQVDDYDCVIVDECHRGYQLDRELGEDEIIFRDEADYISKYRRVLDHFDAVKIGLTATPALHTSQIFGRPVYQYTYREAVIDGYLVDHEPPVRIVTALAEKGIHFAANTTVQTFNPSTKEIDTALLPDDVDIEIEDFNRQVITEPFNRTVCRELVQHIDPALPGKTVIFCVDNTHADLVVTVLKQELKARYEDVGDDVVVKITGKADKPEALLLRFRNERQPSVAVTVDLLTTGIDVPEIVNLVFLRRVKSRILYTQMLGRATRLCPEIGKQSFRIFDAVDLYDALEAPSQMKPVVPNPLISFAQLLRELTTVSSPSFRQDVLDQLVAKIQRRRQGLASGDQAALEAAAGMSVAGLAAHLRQGGPDQAVAWFSAHPGFADLLDRSKRAPGLVYISEHEDEVVRVEAGYGKGSKPKDYLDEFAAYLRDNMNHLPALVAVTQRPRELTRKQLRELKLLLDAAGYPEKHLQAAFRDTTNQDIAASIIGFIRRQTLGEALVPYPERVDRALARILGSRPWTDAQRKWLQRIGKQIKEETIVDREALDQGQFRTDGGFTRLNKVFDGKLEEILGDIQDALWQSAA